MQMLLKLEPAKHFILTQPMKTWYSEQFIASATGKLCYTPQNNFWLLMKTWKDTEYDIYSWRMNSGCTSVRWAWAENQHERSESHDLWKYKEHHPKCQIITQMAETIPLKIKMKDGFTVKMKFACQVTISWTAFDLLSSFSSKRYMCLFKQKLINHLACTY